MGCCEVKEGTNSNSELFLNSSSDDSFNDLSIFSHKCDPKTIQVQLTHIQTLRERSISNSYKASLETAFTLISPQRLTERDEKKDSTLTCENTNATTLIEYQSETLGIV